MTGGKEIGERVLELLSSIDVERPQADEVEVANGLQAYVRALGLSTPSVRFEPDARSLREARVYPARDRGVWRSFTGRQWRLLDERTEVRRRWTSRGWHVQEPPSVGLDPAVEELVRWDRTVLEAGLGWSQNVGAVRRVTGSLAAIARVLVEGLLPPPKRAAALVPLAEAARAGLFAYGVGGGGEGDLVALVRPWMRFDEQGRLHHWEGLPAAEWPNGRGLYFWHGVEMTESAGRFPERLTPARVAAWSNAERRRVAIERIGLERFVKGIGARVVQEDKHGRLWRTEREIDGERFVAVEVLNATEEPDGSRRRYFLRIPPSIRTARQAVAWTFGLNMHEYRLARES